MAIIRWDSLCGNESRYNLFWDDSLTIDTGNPDFSECFQKTILSWVPYFFLSLLSIVYVPYLNKIPNYVAVKRTSNLNVVKTLFCLLLAILSAIDLSQKIIIISSSGDASTATPTPVIDFLDPAMKIVVYTLAGFLTNRTFRKAVHSSGVLFFFWFLQLIAIIIKYRSLYLRPVGTFEQVVTSMEGVFCVTSFLFCLVSDLLPAEIILRIHQVRVTKNDSLSNERQASDNDMGIKLCPQITTPFLSYLFFCWFTPTIYTGWRRTLTNDDIYRIRKEDSCDEILPVFEKYWQLQRDRKDCYDDEKRVSDGMSNGVGGGGYHRLPNENASKKNTENTEITEKSSLLGTPFRSSSENDDRKKVYGSRTPSDKDEEDTNKNVSLLKALVYTFLPYYSIAGVLLLGYDAVAFINPYLLNLLLDHLEDKTAYAWKGYLYAVGMLLASVTGIVCMHHHFNITYTTGMRIRTALTAAIYRKSLTISPSSRKNATVGEVVNLMSVDCQKMQDSTAFVHYVWSAPFMVVVAIYFLWQILGPSSMAGVGFMILVLPLNSYILAKKIKGFQRIQMSLKDSRLKLMNQILSGIKILKLYAWESYFAAKILEIRDAELANLKKSQLVGATTYILWFSSTFLVALLCFATFVLSSPHNILDAQTAFVSLSLIMLLNFPLTILPPSIMFLVQGMVSLNRIEKFLMQEDVDLKAITYDPNNDNVIEIVNGSFRWSSSDTSPILRNVNLRVKAGQLVAVVGPVGCGKSSLLSAILGEMNKTNGSVNVKGTFSYVSQQAWIQNLSVRSNVLFSRAFDSALYDKVLDACALRPDLEILPGRDDTEIGERGINLSGGQKQRISLARAVYQETEVYLLDDTLSAVDAHVSKHIFRQVIGNSGMLKDKTRVLVTNSVNLLPDVDHIVVLSEGRVVDQGGFDELIKKNGDFAEFVRTYLVEKKEEVESGGGGGEDAIGGDDDETKSELLSIERRISTLTSEDEATGSYCSSDQDGNRRKLSSGSSTFVQYNTKPRRRIISRLESIRDDSTTGNRGLELESFDKKDELNMKLIQEEVAEEGAVKLSVLKKYITSSPLYFTFLTFGSLALFIAAQCATNIWLSEWTNDKIYNGTQDRAQTNYRLGVYGGLGAAQTVAVLFLIFSLIIGCLHASKSLHATLLQNIIRCPTAFFDTVPLGRIINRFSKDTDIVDSNIPQFTQQLLTTIAPLISTIIIIAYTIPVFVAVIIPLALFFVLLQRVYVACGRQIKRLDSIRRSPMYAYFSETLTGTSTIRAFRQQDRFIRQSDLLLDNSQRVWFEVFTSNRWIGVWAEFIGDFMIFFTALFSIMQQDVLNASLIGLSLSFVLQVNMSITMTVRSSCELETYIVAVERIKEYSEIENEAEWINEDNRPPIGSWPENGVIEFQEYSTRYRPGLDLVLKDITCRIDRQEKVGIVGRTGAGKSSMSLALFRIVEPASGTIIIDGVDVTKIGLHDIRKKLTVIPQDPVLFSGTLRFNLDPAENFTDSEIWNALGHAHLRTYVESLPDGIYNECGEEGSNLSVGQRQLLCLARALLRRTKILVLDEATAAVDLETDNLIQSTIRSEFKNCTVLTIAHRINTILDYDRIMVLDQGSIKEFSTPKELLADPKSLFYSLAKDARII